MAQEHGGSALGQWGLNALHNFYVKSGVKQLVDSTANAGMKLFEHSPGTALRLAGSVLDKFTGKGLTLSKAYHRSWILPVRVHIASIERLNPMEYNRLMNVLGVRRESTESPYQMYNYIEGAPVPARALQLPYRIVLTSTQGERETWYIENETEFRRLVSTFVSARKLPRQEKNTDLYFKESTIEQHPV